MEVLSITNVAGIVECIILLIVFGVVANDQINAEIRRVRMNKESMEK